MKNFLLVVAVLILFPLVGFAQVEKLPGEACIFTWVFPVADESKISGFRLYSSPVQSGPFSNLVSNVGPTLRTLTTPATFASGTVRTFYVVRSYFSSGAGTVESNDSNSTEVELRVLTPTGLQVK